MKIDQNKLREQLSRSLAPPAPDELRREDNVFFVGGDLPERATVETLFESHYQCHAALFHLSFGAIDRFNNAEALARSIKKNFNVHLVARLDCQVSVHLLERAYAAGVDIVDIPLTPQHGEDSAVSSDAEERLKVIDSARSIFPRWSVVSSLSPRPGETASTMSAIDQLLARDVVPLVTLAGPEQLASEEASRIFSHLKTGWCRKKALIKPLLPLIYLTTPLVPAAPKGALRGFIDTIEDRRLLAASDLRRLLRVKEVEESYASSGL
jgi:hypothetical protein